MTADRSHLTVRHDVNRSLEVSRGGQSLLTYVYAPNDPQMESPRPYFHPMFTLDGQMVTLCRPHDHLWHKGLSWALPNVGPHNFWGGPTYVQGQDYVQLANNGSMDHRRFTGLDVTDGRARISHELAWHTQPADGHEPGPAVVLEARDIAVTVPADDAWVLTFSSAITNVSGEQLDIGSPTTKGRENAGYGGLFWRGPRSFTNGTVLAPGYSGGEQVRGSRGEWMGYTGAHDETARQSTLVMVDDIANLRHPPQWFVRTELWAALNPAPFFSEEVPFGPRQVVHLRYAVVIADGAADAERGEALAELGRAALRERG